MIAASHATPIRLQAGSLAPETYPRHPKKAQDPQTQVLELEGLVARSSSQQSRTAPRNMGPTTSTSSAEPSTVQPSDHAQSNGNISNSLAQDIRYDDTFLPIPVPQGYPEINFKPLLLRTEILIAVLIFNILCLGSIVTVVRCADSKGLYYSNYPQIRLVVRYVPTIVGTLTALLYRSMRDTYARIQPYISMADQAGQREGRGCRTIGLQYVRGVAIADSFTWRPQNRHSLRIAIMLGAWLSAQITGYKAALFSTVHTNEGWIVIVHPTMGWLLSSIYLLLILLYTWTIFKVCPAKTGLKWDPICIVDQLALFHGSNVLDDFRELEDSPEKTALHLLQNKTYRLGYWEKGVNKDLWYGIGRTSLGTRPALLASRTRTTQVAPTSHANAATTYPVRNLVPQQDTIERCSEGETSSKSSLGKCHGGSHAAFCSHPQEYSYSRYPWDRNSLFAPWQVFFWAVPIIGGIGICVYAIASGVVKRGFVINDHRPFNSTYDSGYATFNITSSGGDLIIANFDPGSDILWTLFVFRTVLVILASYLGITWMSNVDQSIRFSQPFTNMYHKTAPADQTILLDYLWGLPGLTTVKALMNGHYKVAWFSILSLASPTFPIIVGGIFTIVNTGKTIYFTITPVIFYLVFSFLVIYLISLPLAWPRRNRRLLRWHSCIADYASLFYASYLLHDPNSQLDISAKNVTQRHLESRVFLEEKLYTIGLYNGVDGECHFGLDVAYLGKNGVGPPHVQFLLYDRRYNKGRPVETEDDENGDYSPVKMEVREPRDEEEGAI